PYRGSIDAQLQIQIGMLTKAFVECWASSDVAETVQEPVYRGGRWQLPKSVPGKRGSELARMASMARSTAVLVSAYTRLKGQGQSRYIYRDTTRTLDDGKTKRSIRDVTVGVTTLNKSEAA